MKSMLSYAFLTIIFITPLYVLANETKVSETMTVVLQTPQEKVQNSKTAIPDRKGDPILISWDGFEMHEEEMFQKWMDKLDLTDEQRQSAKKIHNAEIKELTPLMKQLSEIQEKIKSTKNESRQQYEQILTDKQIQKWHKKEFKNKSDKKMKKHHKKNKKHWWNFDED